MLEVAQPYKTHYYTHTDYLVLRLLLVLLLQDWAAARLRQCAVVVVAGT